MAVIKAFECIRPDEKVADRVAALPYDVYNREEALKEVEREPLSFLAIDRAETQFDSSVDTYADCVYDKARELLDSRIADGTFITDTDKAYYVYELTMNGRTQTGIAACASIDDYNNNIIKKHENTRADKEQDRINHVDRCSAQTGPIFLAYRADEVIRNEVAKAKETKSLYSFTSPDGIRHQVYKISNAQSVENIEKAFAGIDDIYIADGHHRAASAVKVGLKRREEHPDYTGEEEFNYFLSVLFPDEELMIMPYNRVVKDLNGYSKEEFIKKIEEKFEIEESAAAVEPAYKAEFGMYLDEKWYKLKAKKDILSDDTVDGLDVAILQNNLLEPVLGIHDPKTDKRIDFVGGIRGLLELEKRCHTDCVLAFSMYPTSIAELFAVADAGRLMPPKSTWFEPKLRSGLFIHKIEE
ncbi:MAG: DUF1015 domain-containing protein [Lachnospira sp.]|nr:DUF1015 domain-containing protein [Lachnospira sp.]